ncbi:MAG: UDP-glucose 4-epimerase GalE [Armatimonadetes bacterium]|nr:UDP-glucose 4-epimerase GalE [Armatimonadota bacterium]
MVLVIGGAGYVGSHVLHALRGANEAHLAYDDFSSGWEPALKGSPCIRGDLLDTDFLTQTLLDHPEIDTLMVFAAKISVGESVRHPELYHHVNTGGIASALTAMERAGLRRIIMSSTAAVYGNPLGPLVEDHPKNPTSPYGESKWNAERLIGEAGVDSIRFRYFNAAGAAPEHGLGEHHEPEEHLIPLCIDAALGRRDGIALFGEDYPTPDGTCVRDYIHVLDLADAHVRALHYLRANGGSQALNLGTGQGHSVCEVIQTVQEEVGPFDVRHEGRRPGDPSELVARCEKAEQLLGWKATRSDLRSLVRDAAAFRRDRPDGYRKLTKSTG